MSDNHTAMMKSLPADDGWSDAAIEAGQRVIRGTLLKFADWRWTTGKEAAPVADGAKLVAMATVALWVRWQNNKPVEYRQRESNRRLPEREELGYDNEDEWETDRNGEPIDPWRNTRLVYLVDPQTAEAFTFSTSSAGGRGAVADLGDQITRMRTVHPDAVPLIELNAAADADQARAQVQTRLQSRGLENRRRRRWAGTGRATGHQAGAGRATGHQCSRPSRKSARAKWTTRFHF